MPFDIHSDPTWDSDAAGPQLPHAAIEGMRRLLVLQTYLRKHDPESPWLRLIPREGELEAPLSAWLHAHPELLQVAKGIVVPFGEVSDMLVEVLIDSSSTRLKACLSRTSIERFGLCLYHAQSGDLIEPVAVEIDLNSGASIFEVPMDQLQDLKNNTFSLVLQRKAADSRDRLKLQFKEPLPSLRLAAGKQATPQQVAATLSRGGEDTSVDLRPHTDKRSFTTGWWVSTQPVNTDFVSADAPGVIVRKARGRLYVAVRQSAALPKGTALEL